MGWLTKINLVANDVIAVHRDVYVLFQHALHCGGGILNCLGDQRLFFFAELSEHMGDRIAPLGRLPNADPQPRELFCVYGGDDGTDAIVASVAAGRP